MKSIPQANIPDSALNTQRVLSGQPHKIFSAFTQADSLARWWGPSGFKNTFHSFEFKPGGRWIFTMHGPDGTDYPNECVFKTIEADRCVAIEHVGNPHFFLTVTLTARGDQTHLSWIQKFDSPEIAGSLRALCEPANEQNLDRLAALISSAR